MYSPGVLIRPFTPFYYSTVIFILICEQPSSDVHSFLSLSFPCSTVIFARSFGPAKSCLASSFLIIYLFLFLCLSVCPQNRLPGKRSRKERGNGNNRIPEPERGTCGMNRTGANYDEALIVLDISMTCGSQSLTATYLFNY